jgi:hypothetical protein
VAAPPSQQHGPLQCLRDLLPAASRPAQEEEGEVRCSDEPPSNLSPLKPFLSRPASLGSLSKPLPSIRFLAQMPGLKQQQPIGKSSLKHGSTGESPRPSGSRGGAAGSSRDAPEGSDEMETGGEDAEGGGDAGASLGLIARDSVNDSNLPGPAHRLLQQPCRPKMEPLSHLLLSTASLESAGQESSPAGGPSNTPKRRTDAYLDALFGGGGAGGGADDGARRVGKRTALGAADPHPAAIASHLRPSVSLTGMSINKDSPRMASLMEALLKQSLGIPEPSMHAIHVPGALSGLIVPQPSLGEPSRRAAP